MKTMTANTNWLLTGNIQGAGRAIVQESLVLPFSLSNYEALCGQDGLFLRKWCLYVYIEKPQERKTSLSERCFLTLDGIEGKGALHINGQELCPLKAHMELELTEAMRAGGVLVSLVFPPHFPQLYPCETGADLPVEIGLFSASIRTVYFLRIISADVTNGAATIEMEAYGAGRVTVQLRLLYLDALLWSETQETAVQVGKNLVRSAVTCPVPRGARLKVTVIRGGEGCDEAERIVTGCLPKPDCFAHFRKVPDKAVLRELASAGFTSAVLHCAGNEKFRADCAEVGLFPVQEPADFPVLPLLGSETVPPGVCPLPLCGEEQKGKLLENYILFCRETGQHLHLLAQPRQRDGQEGMFAASGEMLPCFETVKRAMQPVYIAAQPDKPCYYPCALFSAELALFVQDPNRAIFRVEARLTDATGKEIKCAYFTLCAREHRQIIGNIQTLLPYFCKDHLLLSVRLYTGEKNIAEACLKIPVAGGEGLQENTPL